MRSIFNEIQINCFRSRITFLRFYSCINYATFKNDTIRKKYISHTHVIADDTNHEIGMSILRTYFPIMDSFRQMQNMDWGNINLSISIFINENFSHCRIGSTIFETIFIIFFGNESYSIMNRSWYQLEYTIVMYFKVNVNKSNIISISKFFFEKEIVP